MTHPHLKTILARIDALLSRQDRVIVAIEGSCGSGKTTLAALLAEYRDCNVFHMDDFFLQPHQRTPERLTQPGGNVDYERFREELLQPLVSGSAFFYRPFDCKSMTLSDPVEVTPKSLNIIEGSYCMHPYFGSPYDLTIFLTVEDELRRQRILQRPAHLHRRFFEEWIPMESRYFTAFSIAESCHLVF